MTKPIPLFLPFARPVTSTPKPLSAPFTPIKRPPHEPDVDSPSVSGKVPYPFQKDGMRWLATQSRCLLADEMGLGKTVQVIRALQPGDPIIIVCPAFLRLVWRDEILEWRADVTPYVCEPGEFHIPDSGIASIVSYDSLPDSQTMLRLVATDARLRNATMVVDEAHYVKNRRAQRTQKVRTLAAHCARVWTLTGTPLLGKAEDLWGVLQSGGLERRVFGNYSTFCSLFNAKKVRFGKNKPFYQFPDRFEDVENGDEIRARLGRVALRRLRKDVLPQLPGKTHQTIPVPCPEELRTQLDFVGASWTNRDELPPFELLSKVRAELARSRIDAVKEQVARFESEGIPLVVFSAHREPIDGLGGEPGRAVITGDTASELRRFHVDAFQTGLLGVLALTIQAGGVGLTLTRAAHVLFVDLAYTPAENAQAEDRLVRIGQKAEGVVVYRMVADHPVDRRVLEILDAKQQLISATTGGAITK